jgi:hypothetical protein
MTNRDVKPGPLSASVDSVMAVLNYWFDGRARIDRNSEMVKQLAALVEAGSLQPSASVPGEGHGTTYDRLHTFLYDRDCAIAGDAYSAGEMDESVREILRIVAAPGPASAPPVEGVNAELLEALEPFAKVGAQMMLTPDHRPLTLSGKAVEHDGALSNGTWTSLTAGAFRRATAALAKATALEGEQ